MVVVEYILTPQILAESVGWHCRAGFRPAYRAGLWCVAMVLGVVGTFFIVSDAKLFGGLILSSSLFVAVSQGFEKSIVWFRTRKVPPAKISMQVDSDGLVIFGNDKNFVAPWAMIRKVVKAPDGYLLYMGTNFIWIPQNAISSIPEMEFLLTQVGVSQQSVR